MTLHLCFSSFRFFSAILVLLYSSYALAAQDSIPVQFSTEEKNWLKKHPQILVGGSPDWTPFNFVEKNGEYTGIANDYLNLIAKKTGLKFNISIDQWSHNLQKIRDKKIDLLPAVYYTEERSQYLTYSSPYFEMLDYFFIRDDLDVNTLADLDGKRVAIPKKYAHEKLLKKHFPKIKIVAVNTFSDALEAVLENRADMLYDTYASLTYTFKQEGINTIVPFKSTRHLGKNSIHIVTQKNAPELASIIQKGLDAISEKEKQGVYHRWLGNAEKPDDKIIDLTAEERQWLKDNAIIRFTGDPNWLPYEAFDEQDNYIGIVAEYLKIIEQKLDVKLEIITTQSWAESVDKVKQGEIDILSETSDSNLKSHLIFTQHYVSSPIVIVMEEDEDYVENIDQIKYQSIAVIKEYGYVPEIIKQHPEIDFIFVNTIQEGLTAVSTGKVDVLLATLAQASYHISELGINNIRIVGKTQFNTKLAFGINKKFAPLVPLFNRALNSISQSEKQAILNAWGKDKFAQRTDYRWLARVVGILLFFMLAILYWNRKLTKEIELRKEAETQTQTVINYIPLQIIVTSLDGHILSANPKALMDYKINEEDIGQYNILEFYADINDRKKIVKEIAENGKVDQKIILIKQPDGTLRSMMLSIMPIKYNKRSALLAIAVDMTERLEFESALQKAKDDAEKANQAKSEFLANMSHEIRTPMNAILGFTELLNEQIQDAKLKSFVKTIQSAGSNLLSLINDILDLSKIEAGKLRIEKTACNPHTLFSRLGDIFALKMSRKNIDFILEIDPVIPPRLMLDEVRLRQVLFNLIGNAVKFTDQGFIKVKAYTDNENELKSTLDLIIDIQDTGVGISEDQQQLVFQAFEQSSGQDVKKFGGTGLGLSISQRLVDMMGGQILLSSQVGQGSTFTIKLTDVNIAPIKAAEEDEKSDNHSQSSRQISFLPGNILIVDDIADNRSLLRANFSETNLMLVEAENGLEAIKLAKQQSFDLILMDIRMPIMDGYQAAREIKAFSDTPIIALTASVMMDEFERIKSRDFQGYLRKPVLKRELMSELSRFLPFTETKEIAHQDKSAVLNTEELVHLPELLLQLKALIAQCEVVSQSNNISDIQRFSNAIMGLTQQFPAAIVLEFATDLNRSIDSFDIAAIDRALNYYPQLLSQLEQLNTVE